jgi:hypothetical protein
MMDYCVFGRVMELVHTDSYYGSKTVSSHTNSIYYAFVHGKYLCHRVDGEIVGFATYGFFTDKELLLDRWDGREVYSRGSDGGTLYVPKFLCRAGRREVHRFVRDIQDYMFTFYPDCDGYGKRVYADGRSRGGKWYRKQA